MQIRRTIQYVVLLLLGAGLLFLTYSHIDISQLWFYIQKCKLKWILLAIGAHLMNHLFRAYRWRLLLRAQGIRVSMRSVFLGEMLGFFLNSLGPRFGEVGRCKALQKLERVPVSRSLGTVVVERSVDLLFFFFGVGLFLFVERENMVRVLGYMGDSLQTRTEVVKWIGLGGGIVVLLLSFVVYRNARLYGYLKRHTMLFFTSVGQSIRSLTQKRSLPVWVLTGFIWLFYFFVEYFSFFAFDETARIGLIGALFVFVSINVSMGLPVPGGLGTYHALVTFTLMQLKFGEPVSLAYATVTHGIQTFNALVIGGLCSLYILFLLRKGGSGRAADHQQGPSQ